MHVMERIHQKLNELEIPHKYTNNFLGYSNPKLKDILINIFGKEKYKTIKYSYMIHIPIADSYIEIKSYYTIPGAPIYVQLYNANIKGEPQYTSFVTYEVAIKRILYCVKNNTLNYKEE